ncbi:CHASE2 domain-containing protein [Leptolyngbya ohadii]|uniref:CHASE2 domain-containing protein n=1 Tax=Leptolyngbya ohadii TaxID=1962290 RepID=UPI000B59D291|nr:CHASE2 domain-containing protein [Leptolyngbya ohadii]
MSRLVVLKISAGNFEQGFPVTLQIGEESTDAIGQLIYLPFAERNGKFPANPDLQMLYQQWQASYRQIGTVLRLNAPKQQKTNISVTQDCQQAAEAFLAAFNQWLRSEEMRSIREKWLEQLQLQDQIRIILQTEDDVLQHFPWHQWELIERYPHAELALSAPSFERIARPLALDQPTPGKVKVLAILGNSEGINVQADRALLEQLPDTEICFLVEPDRQTLNEWLWHHGWDILFFAGHSSSDTAQGAGEIQLNSTDRLTVPQLKYALKNSVQQGLQLAIFNSCDGLGLARDLAELHIPQVVVMREPIPDPVAQNFLRHFLTDFAQGNSFYLAVRSARETLQGLEDQFPCATWLPMICQNPTACPPTWQHLTGRSAATPLLESEPASPAVQPNFSPREFWQRSLQPRVGAMVRAGLVSLCVAAGVMGLRSIGQLQSAELFAFDQFLRLRPVEPLDSRLLIVTIDDAERQQYGADLPELGRISLSDRYLGELLQNLTAAQPRLIGVDLYRDYPVNGRENDLVNQFRQNNQIIGVCKARFAEGDSIAPPPDMPIDRVGFSDFVHDADGVLRRHLLSMTPELIDPGIPCTPPYAFSLQLASRYLEAEQVGSNLSLNAPLQSGNPAIRLLQPASGGYWNADTLGAQILLNYRMGELAPKVSLTQVLSGQVNPEAIKDRIVLIGVTASETDDFWQTPIDPQMPGVLVQAHMVSQLLSAVQEGRSLLWVWSEEIEWLWIAAWAIGGGIIAISIKSPLRLAGAIVGVGGILVILCWGTMLQAGWIPLIPAGMAFVVSSGTVAVWQRSTRALMREHLR